MVDRAAERGRGQRFPRQPGRRLGHAIGHVRRAGRSDQRAHPPLGRAQPRPAQSGTAGRVKKYLTVFNLGLQNTFVYRWNYFLRAVLGLIPLAGTVFLWRAVFKERGGGMHGYDYGTMIYYYLLMILVSNLVTPSEDEWQIAADIRDGQINSFLTKPLSYLAYRFSLFLSSRVVYTIVTLLPIAVIFYLFRQYIALPRDVTTWAVSIFSLLLAAAMQFFITYSLAMMAFWLLEISTIVFIVYSFVYYLGAHMFPVAIIPPAVQAV